MQTLYNYCFLPFSNNGIGALMTFIQLIDAPQMAPWFETNFHRLKQAYNASLPLQLPSVVMSCDLDLETVEPTSTKVFLFELLLDYEGWTPTGQVVAHHLKTFRPELNQAKLIHGNSTPKDEESTSHHD